MLIAVASIKGSPGVTTVALALAARWPGEARTVLVECDPAGGDIAARFGLTLSPGLISLAAAARRATDLDVLWHHTQTLPGGLPVVPGPMRPDQASTALRTLVAADGRGGLLAAAAGRDDTTVIADIGRLDEHESTRTLITAADQLLLVVRPVRDELAHVQARLDQIAACSQRIGLLLAGSGYSSTEVATELGVPVLATIPRDARTAALLTGKPVRPALTRSRLPRAAADLAAAVAAALGNDRTLANDQRDADEETSTAESHATRVPARVSGSVTGGSR